VVGTSQQPQRGSKRRRDSQSDEFERNSVPKLAPQSSPHSQPGGRGGRGGRGRGQSAKRGAGRGQQGPRQNGAQRGGGSGGRGGRGGRSGGAMFARGGVIAVPVQPRRPHTAQSVLEQRPEVRLWEMFDAYPDDSHYADGKLKDGQTLRLALDGKEVSGLDRRSSLDVCSLFLVGNSCARARRRIELQRRVTARKRYEPVPWRGCTSPCCVL
jgi:hypothetical protein